MKVKNESHSIHEPCSTSNCPRFPPLNLIQRQHILIIVNPLQQIQRVPRTPGDVLASPHAEVHPISLIGLQLARLHDASNLRRRNDLSIIRQRQQTVISCGDGPMISLCVRIRRHNIHDIVAGVPRRRHTIPHPNEIVQPMLHSQPLIQNAPEFLARLRPLGSPPEPRTLGLVQRPPEHRHTCVLQLLEMHGDGVDVLHQQRVVRVRRVRQRSLDVEVCSRSVETAPPPLLRRVVQTHGRTPMPHKRHDTTFGREIERLVHVGRRCAPRRPRLGVVHEIDAEDRRRLAHVRSHPLQTRGVLLPAQNILAVDTPQVAQQRLRVLIRGLVHRHGADLVRSPRRRRRKRNRIDEVPAPIALDGDGVGAGVEQDLACGDGRPGRGRGQADLRAAAAVERDGRVFVAVGAVVDEV